MLLIRCRISRVIYGALYWKWNMEWNAYKCYLLFTLIITWLTGSYLCPASRERTYNRGLAQKRSQFKTWSKKKQLSTEHASLCPTMELRSHAEPLEARDHLYSSSFMYEPTCQKHPVFDHYRLLLLNCGVVLYLSWLFWLLILTEGTGPYSRSLSTEGDPCLGSASWVLGVSLPCPRQLTKAAGSGSAHWSAQLPTREPFSERPVYLSLLPTGLVQGWALGRVRSASQEPYSTGHWQRVSWDPITSFPVGFFLKVRLADSGKASTTSRIPFVCNFPAFKF